MATIGGMDLRMDDQKAASGAAFHLSTPAVVDASRGFDDGAQVFVRRGHQYVIVVLPSIVSDASLVTTTYHHVQQMLDVLSIQGKGDLAIPGGTDGDIVWWRHNGKVNLRISVVATGVFSMSAIATIRDAEGNIVSNPPPAPPQWHPAFRYFRLSQTTDDLYEAYRNMYLAYESAASTVYPQVMGETDTKWSKRVARSLGAMLADCVEPGVADVALAFLREQYKANRCALFHAKKQQQPILPGDLSNRKQVAQAYERLARLVIKLCQQDLNAQRHISFITKAGVQISMIDPLAHTFVIAVSPETDFPDLQGVPRGRIKHMTDLATEYVGSVDETGYIHEFHGRRAVTDLSSPHVRSILGHDGMAQPRLITTGNMDDLYLEGVDELEVRHVFSISNRSSPRDRFAL